ncbi:2-dehydropantoate 2-reductase [Thauera humireducens]|uniref:ketopantoate reductase family protein n=1 Tax=Thauera humireducens TaxID=1134435 RepID=UPI002467A4FD|nr:2-dehydropantoate 2-reductase [Thauera humireducens]CAH1747590.1 2-dehydropantoate 2-reductase [Thauera humireducens]
MTATPDSLRSHYPVAIVGAGALGLAFAARLAATGPVAVIARNAARAAELTRGVQIGGRLRRLDVFAPDALPTADWAVLLVKTGDTDAAARLASALRPHGLLSLQNGLIENQLHEACPALAAGQGVTTEGAYRDATAIHPSGAGETLLPPGFEDLAALFVRAGFVARVDPDIARARLAKLLVNLAINPLAALFRVPNGALLEPPHRVLLDTLVREALPVLRANGLDLDEGAALSRVHGVARATAANRASMLQDVLAGRRTEIDAITGALLAMAETGGFEVPTHRAVHTLVRALEHAEAGTPSDRG